MFKCPSCQAGLAGRRTRDGLVWTCPSCSGRLVGMGPLRARIPRPVMNAIWARVREREGVERRTCPACRGHMLEIFPEYEERLPPVDVCRRCHLVWFDPEEFEVLPQLKREEAKELSPKARQALAFMEIARQREHLESESDGGGAPEWWQYVPALFGFPVERESRGLERIPWVTWTLAAVMVGIGLSAISAGLAGPVQQLGLVPAEVFRYGGLTLVTSFFLHAGLAHLIGNLYFFLVFGDDVEDCLGRWDYAGLLLAATVAGGLAHVLGAPDATIPCVGASGGISGVIAFYALRFPHARLGLFLSHIFVFRWVTFPAYVGFLFWLLFQFVGAWLQLGGFSNVSSLAHLGGMGVGVAAALLSRRRGR